MLIMRYSHVYAYVYTAGMAHGAAKSNLTVQYCMPYPNDLLSASYLAPVTNARATGDYFHADDQWAVGATVHTLLNIIATTILWHRLWAHGQVASVVTVALWKSSSLMRFFW